MTAIGKGVHSYTIEKETRDKTLFMICYQNNNPYY